MRHMLCWSSPLQHCQRSVPLLFEVVVLGTLESFFQLDNLVTLACISQGHRHPLLQGISLFLAILMYCDQSHKPFSRHPRLQNQLHLMGAILIGLQWSINILSILYVNSEYSQMIVRINVSGDFGHNRSRSKCFEIQMVTCFIFLVQKIYQHKVNSTNSSITTCNLRKVLSLNQSFLNLKIPIYIYTKKSRQLGWKISKEIINVRILNFLVRVGVMWIQDSVSSPKTP